MGYGRGCRHSLGWCNMLLGGTKRIQKWDGGQTKLWPDASWALHSAIVEPK